MLCLLRKSKRCHHVRHLGGKNPLLLLWFWGDRYKREFSSTFCDKILTPVSFNGARHDFDTSEFQWYHDWVAKGGIGFPLVQELI